jgi:hypothetical protein
VAHRLLQRRPHRRAAFPIQRGRRFFQQQQPRIVLVDLSHRAHPGCHRTALKEVVIHRSISLESRRYSSDDVDRDQIFCAKNRILVFAFVPINGDAR